MTADRDDGPSAGETPQGVPDELPQFGVGAGDPVEMVVDGSGERPQLLRQRWGQGFDPGVNDAGRGAGNVEERQVEAVDAGAGDGSCVERRRH